MVEHSFSAVFVPALKSQLLKAVPDDSAEFLSP